MLYLFNSGAVVQFIFKIHEYCMDPSTLGMVIMLDENSDLWDAADVQEVGFA